MARLLQRKHRAAGSAIMFPAESEQPEEAFYDEELTEGELPLKEELPPEGDPLLARVKKVAQRIIDRVKKVTEDTKSDHLALPTDPTDEVPPLQE